jgi:hypothetical protein
MSNREQMPYRVTALQVQKLGFINQHEEKNGRFDLKNGTHF